ncbi:hypothetical protein KIL84_010857 [Mauremys mutica]|uniref:Uncharacterized protein n=1 Tax=Mauremys mutica TaxID=74926 RepID=A0A9D3XDQ9_9SAUR|nr:hypothetical protein KIL84_010857 [Mauremys mutica]
MASCETRACCFLLVGPLSYWRLGRLRKEHAATSPSAPSIRALSQPQAVLELLASPPLFTWLSAVWAGRAAPLQVPTGPVALLGCVGIPGGGCSMNVPAPQSQVEPSPAQEVSSRPGWVRGGMQPPCL